MESAKTFQVKIKAVVINRQGKVLLLATPPGSAPDEGSIDWDLVSATVHHNQELMQCLHEALNKRLGLVPMEWETTRVIDIFQPLQNMPNPTRHEQLVLVYEVLLRPNIALLDDDSTDWAWFSQLDAAKMLSGAYPLSFTERLSSGIQ